MTSNPVWTASDEDDGEHIAAEQVAQLYARRRLSVRALPLLGALMFVALHGRVPAGRLWAWEGLVAAAALTGIWLHEAHARRRPAGWGLDIWTRLATASSLVSGIAFGAAPWLLIAPGDAVAETITVLLVAGVSATAVTTSAGHLAAFFAISAPLLLGLLTRLASFGGPEHLGGGLMVLAYFAYISVFALTAHREGAEAIRLRRRNESLVADLSESKSSLERIVAERTAELRRAEEQFRQAQKLEAVGRLAGGIAHDFNNVLTVVLGYCDLLLRESRLPEADRQRVEVIQRSAERAASLTRQLLAFSRKQMLRPRVIDLGQSVAALSPMLDRLVGDEYSLVVTADAGPATVFADPDQMGQVVMNLVVNARDAMPGGGTIAVRVAPVELDAAFAAVNPDLQAGAYVQLSVTDTGHGMDAATQGRVFEPFFTTKEAGKGTGLGLSTVYGIVRQSDGGVTVESAPGLGTTFRVFLPRHGTAAVAAEPAGAPGTAGERIEATVLVVEDEGRLGRLVAEILEDAGLRVLLADSPEAAVGIAHAHAGAIDLLLTDIRMPRMNGADLARNLLDLRPGLKAMYMSGHTDDPEIRERIFASGAILLAKPFTRQQLLDGIRRTLAAGPRP